MQHLVSPVDLRRQAELFREAAEQCERLASFLEVGSKPVLQRVVKPTEESRFITAAPRHPVYAGGPSAPDPVPTPSRPPTRIDQVAVFLMENGPKTRGEIIQGLNLPKGTVDMVLNRGEFKRDEEGRWTYVKSDE